MRIFLVIVGQQAMVICPPDIHCTRQMESTANTIIRYMTVILPLLSTISGNVEASDGKATRSDFPSNFLFGAASSAFQVSGLIARASPFLLALKRFLSAPDWNLLSAKYEGGYAEDGKGPSNWDVLSHIPGAILDGKNGDVAVDEYHRYKEDVLLMSEIGVDSYRLSIAWSRIFPEGRGEINPLGVKYYNNLINSLVNRGIQPFVTLCHYDIPQALEDEYGGWLSPNIARDFARYAETCFQAFGDRVKYWATFNEPNVFIPLGYDTGVYPPNRCSAPFGNCSAGNSSTEPYIAAHNVLVAHAFAVDIYRRQYQPHQQGLIGIILHTTWYEPLRDGNSEDLDAVDRILDFEHAWFLDPIVFGEYPAIMHKLVGVRLPSIPEELQWKLRDSYDFIGLNYYSTRYATDASYYLNSTDRDFTRDALASTTGVRNGVPIGPQMATPFLYGVPSGVRKIVEYIKNKYSNPPMFITENGFGDLRDNTLSLEKIFNDTFRVNYIETTLNYLVEAMREGANVRGYFLWSLLDNFEWVQGYTAMYGIYYVDFQDTNANNLRRIPKLSAQWYHNLLKDKSKVKESKFVE